MRRARRAILGGSFDPVHFGHLAIAERLRLLEELDEILFVPARRSPHKRAPRAPAVHRVAMLRLALRGNPAFRISPVELRRRGASYTIDTVRHFAARWGERPTLLLGGDALLDLHTWRESAALLREARVVVYARPGSEAAEQRARALRLTYHGDVLSAIASHELRLLCRAGTSVRYQVPETVRRYIESHRLYGWRERSRP
jgi:nicotinate-nucleotide adenylyltransferase